ncbi:defensin-like [Anastrepha ludens]|uniref:defensin-like n=1 Tax=Anastrepha ludens TaxID=28586 RepID=UPI0023AED076|nr:defensin-like [Anastrepha ludens]
MKTIAIILLALCSCLLLHTTVALPVDDSVEVGDVIVIDTVPAEEPEEKPEQSKESSQNIVIDASIQSTAHIEVPESVAEELIRAMVEAFQKMQVSGDVSVQSHVSMPEEKPVQEMGEQHSRSKRATCDLMDASGWSKTLCAAHCIMLGHRGGYCNGRSICVCRD